MPVSVFTPIIMRISLPLNLQICKSARTENSDPRFLQNKYGCEYTGQAHRRSPENLLYRVSFQMEGRPYHRYRYTDAGNDRPCPQKERQKIQRSRHTAGMAAGPHMENLVEKYQQGHRNKVRDNNVLQLSAIISHYGKNQCSQITDKGKDKCQIALLLPHFPFRWQKSLHRIRQNRH